MRNSKSLNFWFATIFGIGRSPFAPGTAATLVAGVPCFLVVGHSCWTFQLLFATAVFAIGWYVSQKTERELNRHDPGEVVIDELCGYLVAMIGHPVGTASILTGVVFFRIFDIWKPWPINLLERKLRGGLGIMADDVGAGIYANIAGLIILKLLGLI